MDLKLFSRKLVNLFILLVVVVAFPTFDKLQGTYIPGWTEAPHQEINPRFRGNVEERIPDMKVNNYYFYRGNYADYFFGKKGKELKEESYFKWWRLRLGLPPIRSITIDYDPINKEIRGRFEPHHMYTALIIWFVIWLFFQVIWCSYSLIHKHFKRNNNDIHT